MSASTRVVLTTGFAALSLGALAVTTAVPPMAMQTIQVVRPATFTADVAADASGTPTESPPSEDDLDSALALIEQLATVADGRVVTVRLGGGAHPNTATIAPTVPNTHRGSAAITGQEPLDGPATQNAASDLIDGVYSISRYWANYVSLELGPWLINWVPLGYLLSDQILIWYPDFVLPTVDSFVYDFLDPVVNDPLNLAVWFEGIGDILDTAATGISDAISSEINYIVTFGWWPIPLPPLPDLPLPGLTSASTSTTTALTSADADIIGTDETHVVSTEPVDTNTSDEATTEPADTVTDEEAATEPAETVAEDEAVAAEDEAADEAAAEAEAVEKAAGEDSGTPAEDADEPASDADEPILDADEPALDANEADSADESDATEQSGNDADGSETTQQDSAPGEASGDNDSGGAAPNASASDGS